MGIFLNSGIPGAQLRKNIRSPYFVDKSRMLEDMIDRVDHGYPFVCVTKPKRFGKTIMANMIGAFFERGRDMSDVFDHMAIAEHSLYRQYLNQSNVIYINFSRYLSRYRSVQELIDGISIKLIEDLKAAYPQLKIRENSFLREMLEQICMEMQEEFVFVIDEWDAVFDMPHITEEDRKVYIGFLAYLLKDGAYVKLAYMTGILPIIQYSDSATLNNFETYGMTRDSRYANFFGFTDEEVDELYERYKKCTPYPAISRADLSEWYDGYQSTSGQHIYNPLSVTEALMHNELHSYWTDRSPYERLRRYLLTDAEGILEDTAYLLSGGSLDVILEPYSAFRMDLETKNQILSAMIVYGYLDGVVKGTTFVAKIPNKELRLMFEEIVRNEPRLGYTDRLKVRSRQILDAVLRRDADSVAEVLDYIHNTETPILSYNSEIEMTNVVTLAFLEARDRYDVTREDRAGKGYADFMLAPYSVNDDGIILELKKDGTPEEAIAQIKDKQYVNRLRGKLAAKRRYSGRIVLVGIAYDSSLKVHRCKIEMSV